MVSIGNATVHSADARHAAASTHSTMPVAAHVPNLRIICVAPLRAQTGEWVIKAAACHERNVMQADRSHYERKTIVIICCLDLLAAGEEGHLPSRD